MSADTIRELMNAYETKKLQWIATYGNAKGFDSWFTQQVRGLSR